VLPVLSVWSCKYALYSHVLIDFLKNWRKLDFSPVFQIIHITTLLIADLNKSLLMQHSTHTKLHTIKILFNNLIALRRYLKNSMFLDVFQKLQWHKYMPYYLRLQPYHHTIIKWLTVYIHRPPWAFYGSCISFYYLLSLSFCFK
jgi:hypothetical protein